MDFSCRNLIKKLFLLVAVEDLVKFYKNQILNIDTANSSITIESDTFVGGSATAGVGYTTTPSY